MEDYEVSSKLSHPSLEYRHLKRHPLKRRLIHCLFKGQNTFFCFTEEIKFRIDSLFRS